MTLRAKLLLLLGSMFVGLVAVIYGTVAFFQRRSLLELETQLLTADALRAQNALQETLADLDRRAGDAAVGVDVLAIIQGSEREAAADRLWRNLVVRSDLNGLLILNADGDLVLAQGRDRAAGGVTAVSPAWLTALQPLLQPDQDGFNGVLLTPEKPVLVAAHPVLPPSDLATPAGLLVVGRYLDDAENGRLAQQADLALGFQPVTLAQADHPALIEQLLGPDDLALSAVLVEPQSRQKIHAYRLVPGLDGEPALLLTIMAPRPLYQQGLNSLQTLFWLLLVASVIIGGFGLMVVERLVFNRVALLSGQVNRVAQTGDTGQRIQLSGQDELSALAATINEMIAQLDKALAEQRETDENLQQNLHKTTLLYRVIAAAAALRDPHQVMELVCIELAQALQLPQVIFTLLSSDNSSLRVVAEHASAGKPSSLGLAVPVEDSLLIQTALSTGQPVYIADAQTDPRYGLMQGIARERGTISAFLVPLVIKTQVAGILELNATENREFSSGETDIVESVVRATSRALENARLYSALETELEQRKQAEKELQKAKEWAETANFAKTEFISTISHELRVPLTAIQGFADLMLRRLMGPVSEGQERYLQTIISNAVRLNNLISDLSDISRIETGRFNLQFNPVNVYELIEEAVTLTEDQIKRRNHTLDLRLQAGIPPVWADRGRLMQILTNLISNAYKFTSEGGLITISARATIRKLGPRRGLKVAQITVSDNGIGISQEEQPRIFERFFRSDDDQARDGRGTGLGLSIVKNLLELQGGRIWFESVYGEGTSFHFIIPLMDQLDPLQLAPRAASGAVPQAAGSPQKSQI
jgi:signal transduction histidine kinase/sensor domain CHASE-containing protein